MGNRRLEYPSVLVNGFKGLRKNRMEKNRIDCSLEQESSRRNASTAPYGTVETAEAFQGEICGDGLLSSNAAGVVTGKDHSTGTYIAAKCIKIKCTRRIVHVNGG